MLTRRSGSARVDEGPNRALATSENNDHVARSLVRLEGLEPPTF
jgi:hypothetical protein